MGGEDPGAYGLVFWQEWESWWACVEQLGFQLLLQMQPEVETPGLPPAPKPPASAFHWLDPAGSQLTWEHGKQLEGVIPYPYSTEQSREG